MRVSARYAMAAACAVLIGALSLSVHVVMMQVLNIPYPAEYAPGWLPTLLNRFATVLASIVFYALAYPRLRHLSVWQQVLVMTLLLSALSEGLLRGPVMNGVVSSFWLQAFVANSTFAAELWVSLGVVILQRATASRHDGKSNLLVPQLLWRTVLAALLIALCWQFLLRPLAGQLNALLMAQLLQPRPDQVLLPPYGPDVLIPAYLTYAEPVVACCVMAWLSWGSLSQRPVARIAQFTVLMVFLKGMALPPFFNIFYASLPPGMAVLSMGQFALEMVVLAFFTALFMTFFYPRAKAVKGSP